MLVLLVMSIMPLVGASDSETPARVDLERVLAEARYQTELPGKIERLDRDPPSWLKSMGPLFELVLWIALAIFLILVVIAIFRHFQATADASNSSTLADMDTDTVQRSVELSAVQLLANRGRYDEALHELLLLTIDQLSNRLSLTERRSKTSRELGARLPADYAGRKPFAALVRAVEHSYFGGTPVTVEIFQIHLTAYRVGLEVH